MFSTPVVEKQIVFSIFNIYIRIYVHLLFISGL